MKSFHFRFFLILSFISHLLLVMGTLVIDKPTRESKTQVTEIEFIEDIKTANKPIEPLAPEAKQIVDQSDQAVNDQVDPKAKFLSKNNQAVKKQTVAQKRGEFVNSDGSGNMNGNGSYSNSEDARAAQFAKFKPQFDVQKMVEKQIEKDQLAEKALEQAANQRMAQDSQKKSIQDRRQGVGGSQASQTLDYIKDLEPGLETLLSTKEFKFHSFYSRVRVRLNEHWTPIVRQKMESAYKKGRSIASTEDRVTKLLVTLDRNGNLVKVQVISDSGISDIDQAAAEAFRSAAPFPNPPKGMVDEDGQIKLRWDFVIEA